MILDVLKTAARFPQREGVIKAFNLGAYNDPKYQQTRDAINALPNPIIPAIADFVFGVDEEVIKKAVNNISGYFLFVDYGDIESRYDDNGRMKDSFNLSFTVAKRYNDNDLDQIASAVVSENCLEMAATIKRTLVKEQKDHAWCKDIEGNSTFSPFVSRELGAIGWSLIFDRQGLDLLKVK